MENTTIERKEAITLLKTRMDIIRNNIRKLMGEKNITQKELGDRIDSDKFYIRYVLTHPAANPSIKSMEKIAWALKTDLITLAK